MTCIQTIQYYRSPRAKSDVWYLRVFVSILSVIRYGAYIEFPTGFGVVVRTLTELSVNFIHHCFCRLLDGTHQAMVIHAYYEYLVIGFGDLEILVSVVW